DGDGRLDLVIGEYYGAVRAYRNTGSGFAAFEVNPFRDIHVGRLATPVFVDLDGDRDLDLVVGSKSGALVAYENTTVRVNLPPTVTSGAAANFAENGTGNVYRAAGTDPEGVTLSWSL